LVGGEKKNTRIIIERALGPVAMVQVPIHDQDLFQPIFFLAYIAAIATLLKMQKPIPRSGSAWWPGGRTKAKIELGVLSSGPPLTPALSPDGRGGESIVLSPLGRGFR